MELTLFTRMLQDKHFTDYKKMQYKYGKDFEEFDEKWIYAVCVLKVELIDYEVKQNLPTK